MTYDPDTPQNHPETPENAPFLAPEDEAALNEIVAAFCRTLETENIGPGEQFNTVLAAQAQVLDALFVKLADIGMDGRPDLMTLALALRSQQQCRSTIKTLRMAKENPANELMDFCESE